MKGISEQKLLSEINIPGTHDSGTKNLEERQQEQSSVNKK